MKRKIFALLVSVFFAFVLWAQEPTKDFPYRYYNSTEKSYYAYSNYFSSGTELEDDDEWKVVLYQYGTTHFIVTKYKPGKAPSETELKKVLKEHVSVYKELDSKIDKNKKTNYDVCLIFVDSSNNLICSATYSEDYK